MSALDAAAGVACGVVTVAVLVRAEMLKSPAWEGFRAAWPVIALMDLTALVFGARGIELLAGAPTHGAEPAVYILCALTSLSLTGSMAISAYRQAIRARTAAAEHDAHLQDAELVKGAVVEAVQEALPAAVNEALPDWATDVPSRPEPIRPETAAVVYGRRRDDRKP